MHHPGLSGTHKGKLPMSKEIERKRAELEALERAEEEREAREGSITVRDLIDALNRLPPDASVVWFTDGELFPMPDVHHMTIAYSKTTNMLYVHNENRLENLPDDAIGI